MGPYGPQPGPGPNPDWASTRPAYGVATAGVATAGAATAEDIIWTYLFILSILNNPKPILKNLFG